MPSTFSGLGNTTSPSHTLKSRFSISHLSSPIGISSVRALMKTNHITIPKTNTTGINIIDKTLLKRSLTLSHHTPSV